MTTCFAVGDRVRIRRRQRVYVVAEVNSAGVHPAPPSTYTVRLQPEMGEGAEMLYGDAALVKVA